MYSNSGDDIQTHEGTALADSLLVGCQTLLNELEQFGCFIEKHKKKTENTIDIRKFQTLVAAEYNSLKKLSEADQSAEKTIHALRSSNLPFYAATWEAAKANKALVAFHQRFYWDNRPTRESKKAAQKRCALVDIVARDGEEWVKVSIITEERLQFEIAKAEWEEADSSPSDGEDTEDGTQVNGDADSPYKRCEEGFVERIGLVRTANDLARASNAHRIHYKHPQVRLVLTKFSTSPPPEILPILDRIRSTGAAIYLGPQLGSPGNINAEIFPNLLPSPHPPLTNTLNIDCTILLALVSDLSHTTNHPILPEFNTAITRQIELETRDNLLPSSLWPAIIDKELVCTQKAAKRMKEIVDTLGTPNERSRTELLLSRDSVSQDDVGEEELRQQFARYSDHTIPSNWRLPIRIVDDTALDSNMERAIQNGNLPSVAKDVAKRLSDNNRSTFIYGWLSGTTTVSSNRTVAKQIEAIVEKDGQGAMGPEIWVREPARSLLGKEKERRK